MLPASASVMPAARQSSLSSSRGRGPSARASIMSSVKKLCLAGVSAQSGREFQKFLSSQSFFL